MSSTTESQIKYAGDGEQVLFTFPFTYLQSTDIYVCLYNETERRWDDTTEWTFANATTIQFTTAPPSPTGVVTDNIKIERRTSVDPLVAQFNPGSAIRASDLNNDFEQLQLAVIDNSSRVTSIDVGVNSLTTSGDGLSVDQNTGNITISNTGVTRINNETGDVSLDTDDIPEGSINLYYTDARVSAWIAANLSDTDDLKEGVLNLYYTDARVNAWINTNLSSTDQLAEGSNNLYYTDARAEAVVVDWIQANLSDTDDLPEGSNNLYYTDARVESVIDGQGYVKGPVVTKIVAGNNIGISPESGTGIVTINASGGSGTGIPDAPLDGTTYGRQDGHWEPVLMLTGGNMTGDLTLGTDKITLDASAGSAEFAGDVTISAGEGISAALYLAADQGDDNGDTWRIISNQDDNRLGFSNNVSGSYADKVRFFNDGSATFAGDVTSNGLIFGNQYRFSTSTTLPTNYTPLIAQETGQILSLQGSSFKVNTGGSASSATVKAFEIDGGGAAAFVGNLAFAGGKGNAFSTTNGVNLELRSDTANDQVFAILKNGAGAGSRTAFINSDGSATFASTITAGGYSMANLTQL